MDRDQERAIEWDCAQVVNKFYCSLDARRYDDLVNCFTPDGVWKRQGNELQGRDAIMAAMHAELSHRVPASMLSRVS